MGIKTKAKENSPEQRRGNLIRSKRSLKKLSQEDLAEWINKTYSAQISQQRVSHVENGADLTGNEIFYFAYALDIELEEMSCLNPS